MSVIDDEILFTYSCRYSDYFYVLVVQNAPSDQRVVRETVRCELSTMHTGRPVEYRWICWPCAVVIIRLRQIKPWSWMC